MWNQIRGRGQINPRSELDQWMRKLTFRHKAGGWEGGTGTKHRDTQGAGWWMASWKCPHGPLSHVGESGASIRRFQRSDSQRHRRASSVHMVFMPRCSGTWFILSVTTRLSSLYFPGVPTMHPDYLCSLRRAMMPSCVTSPKKHHIFLSAPVAHLDRKSVQGCMSFNFTVSSLFRYRCTNTHRRVYLATHFLLGPRSDPAETPLAVLCACVSFTLCYHWLL